MTEVIWKIARERAAKQYEDENDPKEWENADKYEREDYTFHQYTKILEQIIDLKSPIVMMILRQKKEELIKILLGVDNIDRSLPADIHEMLEKKFAGILTEAEDVFKNFLSEHNLMLSNSKITLKEGKGFAIYEELDVQLKLAHAKRITDENMYDIHIHHEHDVFYDTQIKGLSEAVRYCMEYDLGPVGCEEGHAVHISRSTGTDEEGPNIFEINYAGCRWIDSAKCATEEELTIIEAEI